MKTSASTLTQAFSTQSPSHSSNAALEYCNREIAKCQEMIRIWPHEQACLLKLIAGWQRTKRQLR
ncbi:hypothetical protein [Shewanella sp.]|uniref:hypothetical protein n=1 Tax=Shewanella sp. TaxID=50422 RepID=UPI00405492C4